MSPICPRCGGELRPASINAWVHVWQDKEDDCYMRGKDGVPVLATGSIGERLAPVPANPDGVVRAAESLPSTSVGDSLPSDVERQRRTAEDEVFGWTPTTVRSALNEKRLPSDVYQRLVTYAALYVPSAVYQEKRYGRTVLSYRRPLTDAEITEALR